jgi:SM-20-related protein
MLSPHLNPSHVASREELDLPLFSRIAADLTEKGYSISPESLSLALIESLKNHVLTMSAAKFEAAGVGRGETFVHSKFVRTDEICWITGDSEAGGNWLMWASALQRYLNKKLLLGLFSFESHFSHYSEGDYYKRHRDSFRGEANRVLSLVLYLNPGWTLNDGGELVLYEDDQDIEGIKVTPLLGTLVVFLSEDFPHEVLPANRDRYAIAGWFRVNTSVFDRVDPPR